MFCVLLRFQAQEQWASQHDIDIAKVRESCARAQHHAVDIAVAAANTAAQQRLSQTIDDLENDKLSALKALEDSWQKRMAVHARLSSIALSRHTGPVDGNDDATSGSGGVGIAGGGSGPVSATRGRGPSRSQSPPRPRSVSPTQAVRVASRALVHVSAAPSVCPVPIAGGDGGGSSTAAQAGKRSWSPTSLPQSYHGSGYSGGSGGGRGGTTSAWLTSDATSQGFAGFAAPSSSASTTAAAAAAVSAATTTLQRMRPLQVRSTASDHTHSSTAITPSYSGSGHGLTASSSAAGASTAASSCDGVSASTGAVVGGDAVGGSGTMHPRLAEVLREPHSFRSTTCLSSPSRHRSRSPVDRRASVDRHTCGGGPVGRFPSHAPPVAAMGLAPNAVGRTALWRGAGSLAGVQQLSSAGRAAASPAFGHHGAHMNVQQHNGYFGTPSAR